MNPRTLRGVAAAGLMAVTIGTSACTTTGTPGPTTPTASPTAVASSSVTPTTASATPTQTPDADQANALGAAEQYEAVMAKVRANPPKYGQYKMIELLKPLAFDDWIQASLNGVQPWRDKGWHEEGTMKVLARSAGQVAPAADGAAQVKVTLCKDTRGSAVVDKNGKNVKDQQFPTYLKRTYDMRRAKGSDSFRVWEAAGEEVQGCN